MKSPLVFTRSIRGVRKALPKVRWKSFLERGWFSLRLVFTRSIRGVREALLEVRWGYFSEKDW